MTAQIWVWVWNVANCEGGDLDAIVRAAQARKVGIFVKTHDGATDNPNGAAGYELCNRARAAGVPVFAWGYVYPEIDARAQARKAAQAVIGEGVQRPGARGYIADAEIEWEGHPGEARAYVDALNQQLGAIPKGYSPLAIRSYHSAWPYDIFDELDARHPQSYQEITGDPITTLNWAGREWAGVRPPVIHAVQGWDVSADDLRRAIVRAGELSVPAGAVSVWSWEHLSAECWAVIGELANPSTEEDSMTGQELYDKIASLIQDKVVAPQHDTNTAVAQALAAQASAITALAATVSDEQRADVSAALAAAAQALDAAARQPR